MLESLPALQRIIQLHATERVVLIGPQSAGKTTLAQAAACDIPWFDSDALLLDAYKKRYGDDAADSIREVYRALGWWRFRLWESRIIAELAQIPAPAIMSLGGGAHLYCWSAWHLFTTARVVGIDRALPLTWGVRLRRYFMLFFADDVLISS